MNKLEFKLEDPPNKHDNNHLFVATHEDDGVSKGTSYESMSDSDVNTNSSSLDHMDEE